MPRFKCGKCDKRFEWKPELAGRKVKCSCGTVMVVPQSRTPTAPTKEPVSAPDPLDALAGLEAGQSETVRSYEAPPPQRKVSAAPSPAAAPAMPHPAGDRKSDGGWFTAILNALNPFSQEVKSRKQQLAQFWIYSVGLILLGGAFAGACYLNAANAKAFLATAQQTQATITAAPDIRHGGRKWGKLNPENWYFDTPVHFEVEGKPVDTKVEILGKRPPSGLQLYDGPSNSYEPWVGKTIAVHYDPADPTRAKASIEATNVDRILGYITGATVALIGLLVFALKWPYRRSG